MEAKEQRLRPIAKSLPQTIRDFLTPEVFKQVRKVASRRKQPRWDVHPLLYVLLLMTWCAGDSGHFPAFSSMPNDRPPGSHTSRSGTPARWPSVLATSASAGVLPNPLGFCYLWLSCPLRLSAAFV